MVEEVRLLCHQCIRDYAKDIRQNVLPAITITEGRSLCWFHAVEFDGLNEKLHVEYDRTTYPPSYEVTRKSK